MKPNLLAISVGNTRTRIGTFLDGVLVDRTAFDHGLSTEKITEQLNAAYEPLRDSQDPVVILASVNATQAEQITQAVGVGLGLAVQRIEQDVPVPIGRQLDPETIVGDDRLLNAAAAYDVLKQACIVVDAGTALTVDFVDGAGTFHGGAIAPGAPLMLRSLHEHTAQLPEVTLAKPDEPIGHNTVQAMRSAAYHGIRGMVRELVEQFAEVAGAYPIVIATGGDAEVLFKDDELFDRIVPDLTLQGIALTRQSAMQTK